MDAACSDDPSASSWLADETWLEAAPTWSAPLVKPSTTRPMGPVMLRVMKKAISIPSTDAAAPEEEQQCFAARSGLFGCCANQKAQVIFKTCERFQLLQHLGLRHGNFINNNISRLLMFIGSAHGNQRLYPTVEPRWPDFPLPLQPIPCLCPWLVFFEVCLMHLSNQFWLWRNSLPASA